MLKIDSITYSSAAIHTKRMKKQAVADSKNKNKANYKDTRITLKETVLVPFFIVTLNVF